MGQCVFCKPFLNIIAKYFWTLLHVQIGQSCKASVSPVQDSLTALQTLFICYKVSLEYKNFLLIIETFENREHIMETATLQKRKLFDGVRGGAICLVVLGHIIQTFYSADFDSNICFRIIYSFHMPLFMFVSGALVYNPERPINFNWVKKKFKMLVIPFILWIPIAYIIAKQYTWISFEDRIIQVIESPDNAMWFLWVLFLLHVLMFFLLSVYNGLIN